MSQDQFPLSLAYAFTMCWQFAVNKVEKAETVVASKGSNE